MAVEDVTGLLDREEGTAFDERSLLFGDFNDGGVFNYDSGDIRDRLAMLDKDGKASTLEKVLTLPIRQAPWSIQRGQASRKVTRFVHDFLAAPANNGGMSTPLDTVIAQMTGSVVTKKAYFEKVLTERDGQIVYDKLAWRPATTCAVVRDPRTAAFQGFKQIPYRREGDLDEVTIPARRAFVHIHGRHRNPLEGVSDFEIPYWCYVTKQKIRFLWYAFLETQSLPRTLVQADDATTARESAKEVAKLRNNGVVGLERRVSVETLESSGRGASQFKEALQWLDSEASGSVLAGFTDLGSAAAGGTGSFALSKDMTDFFLMSRQSDSREMASDLSQYVIPDLVRYNFGPNEPSPEFEFGPIAEDDAAMAISLLQATAQTPMEQSVLPREFFDELTERVAGFLQLNVGIVRDGLERAKKEAEQKAAQTTNNPVAPAVAGAAGAVQAATNAVVRRIGDTTDVVELPKPGMARTA